MVGHASDPAQSGEVAEALRAQERVRVEQLRELAGAALAVTRESDEARILALAAAAARTIVGVADAGAVGPDEDDPVRPPGSLAIPITASDGRQFAVLQLSAKLDGTPFSESDEALLVQLAQITSAGMENAELVRREREARAAAEEQARLQRVLSEAGAAFAASLDLKDVLGAITESIVPEYADWCGVSLLRTDGEIQLVAEAAVDDLLAQSLAALRVRVRPTLETPHGTGAVIRTGTSEFFPEVPEDVWRSMAENQGVPVEELMRLRIRSGVVVPLPARGRTLGAVTLVRTRPEPYDELELRFAEDLAARAALAIENATLFSLERQVADVLQRSLLPRALPRIAGVRAAARYLPGASGMRVGGDWYDVIVLDEHRLALVVGDVMGRGVLAATVMGQLRAALRAYVIEGHPPGRVLEQLDEFVDRSHPGQFTTCVFGIYDAGDSTLTVACAGHPAPLVVAPDGDASFLDLEAGLPLGAGSLTGASRAESVIAIRPGSTVLFYTDGLVEGREQPVDEGMARLRQAATGWVDDPDRLCDRLLKAMNREGHHDDDTALLAVAVGGGTGGAFGAGPDDAWGEHELALDLRSPGEARRIVRETLGSWGVGNVDTAVLVAHELVANAVLHGRAPVVLRLRQRPSSVRIEVADGHERPPHVQHYGEQAITGRGLAMVEALARSWGWQAAGLGKVVWCEVAL
jgi:serine phosphatase RsbU (regulator of sigma subunit)/anti-sigma regulatory factor (Ser/Thr protein kinase)